MIHDADIAILGAGPAGYAAALAASQRGKATVLVAGGPLGGTCLHWGCIPTKLALGVSEPLEDLRRMTRLRLVRGEARLDLPALRRRTEAIIAATVKAMAARLERGGVTVLAGRGQLTAPGEVAVPELDARVRARTVILATGSRPRPLPGVPFGGPILDSTALLARTEDLTSLVIVGGGAIGIEMAQFWNRLGTQVTLVEAAPHLLPAEDPVLGEALAAALRRDGIAVRVAAPVQAMTPTDDGVQVALPGETLQAQLALVAVGRQPATEGLGLEAAGARLDSRGFVVTDESLLAAPGLYAVGDVNGRTLLAHAAEHQARFAVAHALGEVPGPYRPGPIPACVYGGIEVLRVGPTRAEMTGAVLVSQAPLAANPMAQAHGHPHGMVRVYWQEGRVLAVAAVGGRVTHLAGLAEAMVREGWGAEAAHTHVFAHPSLDEAVRDALLAPQEPL